MENTKCPFELGEIVVFESSIRFETYISRIRQFHIDYYDSGAIPTITKATLEQKEAWFNCGKYELILEEKPWCKIGV